MSECGVLPFWCDNEDLDFVPALMGDGGVECGGGEAVVLGLALFMGDKGS